MNRDWTLMPKFFAVAFAVLLLTAAMAQAAAGQERTWITNVNIVSPEQLDHVDKGSVLIENGRIVSVARNRRAKKPSGARVVSGEGQFLIPGLIDSHVHLASVPGVRFEDVFDPEKPKPEMVWDYFEQLPRSYLYFGYTTLIDLAVIDRSPLDRFRQAPLHPDLYDCGPSLPVANGYPMSEVSPQLRFELFPNWLLDPPRASNLPAGSVPEKHTPAAAVATVKASGGICVKTYFEHGFGADRNLPMITPDLIAQVRKAAHENGLVLMMHANSFEAQKFAVESGVDVIAHGMWNWGDLANQPDLPDEIKSVLDRIVENKIGYQATMQVMGGFRAYFDPEYLQMKSVAKVTPPRLLAWFNTPVGKWFKQEISGGAQVSDDAARNGLDRGPIRRGDQVVAYLAAKNARFLFGTDTPSAPTYGNLPGLNGYLEMRDLSRAGLSLSQIFKAATLENARMFHLDSQVGTIEPGKIANLVLLKKSPLESVDAYDSVVTIWVHGKAVARESLAAGAGK